MEQKFDSSAVRDAMRRADSPAGRRLLEILQQSGGKELQQAMNLASAGNYAQAQQALSALLSDPEAQALLRQLQE